MRLKTLATEVVALQRFSAYRNVKGRCAEHSKQISERSWKRS
jgi:hypothetical protein